MAFKEKIDHNSFVLIKWIVLGIFWMVCVGFTIFVFMNLANDWVKWVWLFAALAWEGGVLVVVSLLKTSIVKRENVIKIVGLCLAYLLMGSVTFFGSLGFNVANTHKQTVAALAKPVDVKGNEYLIEQAKKANEAIDADIAALSKQRDAFIDTDQQTKADVKQAAIDKKQKEKDKNNAAVGTKSGENTTSTVSTELAADDIFTALGGFFDAVNWNLKTGTFFKSLIFIIFGLTLLLMVALAAPTIEEAVVVLRLDTSVDVVGLQKYLEAMFDVTGRRLAKDEIIVDKTKLTIEKCKEFRAYLMKLTYKGLPLFTRDSGGTKANFPKEQVIKIAAFYARVSSTPEAAAV
jgi:hypothetical protein